MRIISFIILLLTCSAKADHWVCTEESSQRTGNQVLACGIGLGLTENDARKQAFENASTEFDNICKTSADCKGHSVVMTPKRTTCEQLKRDKQTGYKCYRALEFEISESISSNNDDSASSKGAGSTGEKGTASAEDFNPIKRVVSECTEKVFNKSWGLHPTNIISPMCSSKSGKSNPYDVALTYFKIGVVLGDCNYSIPESQGLIDADVEFGFDVNPKVFTVNEECRAQVQRNREETLSELNQCFNGSEIAKIIDTAKTCGEGVSWSYGDDKYATAYKETCLTNRNNKAVCSKLAAQSHFNFYMKHSKEMLAGQFDPYSILKAKFDLEANKPKECENGNAKDCYKIGSEKSKKGLNVEANSYFKKACDGGNMSGCTSLGAGEFDLGHKVKAYSLFKKACAGDNAVGCSFLGMSERQNGNLVAADAAYKKACEYRDQKACELLKQPEQKQAKSK